MTVYRLKREGVFARCCGGGLLQQVEGLEDEADRVPAQTSQRLVA